MTNNGCKRYCDVVNRPAYIVLFKGDDSDFTGNQTIEIDINTELDLTGFKAYFRFMDFEQAFNDITSKKLELVFPNSQTSRFPLGAADASLVIVDDLGKRRTVNNRIHIVVTNSVMEAYANEDPQAITVSVSGIYIQKQSNWTETNTGDPSYIQNKPELAAVATSGSYNDLDDKPTIPPAVSVVSPSPSAQTGQAADAKSTGIALYTGFTEWTFSDENNHIISIVKEAGEWWYYLDSSLPSYESFQTEYDALSATALSFDNNGNTIEARRHLVTPTKTSQLTNDGAPDGGGTPYATTAQIPTVPSAYASTPAMDGVGSAGSSTAWAKGDHVHPSDTSKASLTDLPYAMVTPGEWEFSGVPSGWEITGISYDLGDWTITYLVDGEETDSSSTQGAEDTLSLTFAYSDEIHITATRPSLPGHLLDRAGNRVVVTGATTLTLPAAIPGYIRDFLVRLEISGSTVPTITFAAPTGETLTYETDGDEFPVPDETGNWLYSFTESCVAHTFAVSLKKVNVVTQGGS